MYKKYWLIIVSLFFNGWVLAQPEVEFAGLQLKYPGESLLTLKNNEDLSIEMLNGRPIIRTTSYTERIYMNSRAGLFSNFSIEYSDLNKIKSIEAASLVPGKRDYKEVSVKEFKDEEVISENVFYDGTRTISFFYPQMEPGVKTKVKYMQEITEPRLLGSFFFQSYSPVLEASYTISTTKDVAIGWKIFNSSDTAYTFTKTEEKNNRVTYTWRMKNLPKYESDDQAPDIRYTLPHIVAWIQSYKSEGKTVPVLSELPDLYNWVSSISHHVNKEDNANLKKLVDSLVTGIADEELKVKTLFYWVQDHIRYIAFEDGMGGFVPRSATQVIDKRFGDCKDMASLLNTMLRYAGINSHLTWIGSRELPYSYKDVPTPVVDDHMIVTYIHNGKYTYLDATGENIPYGMPTWYIQGKEAMIGIDSAKFEVKTVPFIDAEKNLVWDSVSVMLENTGLKGVGKCVFNGYAGQSMSDNVSANITDLKKLFRGTLSKGNNRFLIDSLNVNDHLDRDTSLVVDYTFNVSDYIRIAGDELYINLNLDKYLINDEIEKDRKLPIMKKFKSHLVNKVCLELPVGYKINYVPKNVTGGNEKFSYAITYTQQNNKLLLDCSYYTREVFIQPSDFEAWNKMVRELKNAYSDVVILKKS